MKNKLEHLKNFDEFINESKVKMINEAFKAKKISDFIYEVDGQLITKFKTHNCIYIVCDNNSDAFYGFIDIDLANSFISENYLYSDEGMIALKNAIKEGDLSIFEIPNDIKVKNKQKIYIKHYTNKKMKDFIILSFDEKDVDEDAVDDEQIGHGSGMIVINDDEF